MAIWGSLIGGMIGFSLGGPFGMLLGSLIGGKISRARSSSGFKSFAQPQQIFALSLIVLSAKLSKADGQISKEELIAVKDKLKIPENEIDQVGKIFNKAKEESAGYEPYAQQIAQIYRGNINVLEEVINILFYIAEADGNVSNAELKMIEHISQIFGLTKVQFNSIKESRKAIPPRNKKFCQDSGKGFPIIPSIIKNTRCPPSRAGIGIKLTNPRLIEIRATKNTKLVNPCNAASREN